MNKTQSTISHIAAFAAIAIPAMILAVSCNPGKSGEERTGKLRYEPETAKVGIMRLEKGPFLRQLTANGKLQAHRKISMYFDEPAVVTEIRVKNGQTVEKGDTIAIQDARARKSELESARIAMAKAELDYMDFLAGQGISPADTASAPLRIKDFARIRSGYEEARNSLKRAEQACEDAVLTAPFSGKVADIALHVYDKSGSDAFCTLIDDSRFDVGFTVLESEYSFVKTGMEVSVKPFFGNSGTLEGRISDINPSIGENGQVAVRAAVDNDGSLVDGMNVKLTVERPVQDMLVVPKSAVLIRDNLEVLFRYSGGKAMWTYVNVLMSNSDSHAVTANRERGAELSPGDTVIISGNLNLADGSEVIIDDK